jgi:hypothetical protein
MTTTTKQVPRITYANVYAAHERLAWTNDVFGTFAHARLNAMYEPAIKADMVLAYFEQYPRRRKFNLLDLDPATRLSIIFKWREIALANFEAWSRRYKKLGALLDRLSITEHLVIHDIPEDAWPVLKSADSYEYHTQGYGAAKYARGSLVRYEIVLSGAEIPHRIDMVNHTDANGQVDQYHANFLLKAPLSAWQLDMLMRAYRPTPAQWAWDCWEHGVNPRVYYPYLDTKIFNETMHCMGAKDCPRPRAT